LETVFIEFNDRKNEIQLYINFINLSENNSLIYNEVNKNGINKSELRRIFLANAYLLLYNLVESTIRNTIQEIYDHLNLKSVSFDVLKPNIKETILQGLKTKSPIKIVEDIENIAADIISISFDPDKISNGNIDAKKIREIARKYCFSDMTDYSKCKNGEKLLEIKNKRNNLSHGIVSFSECGREISISDLNLAFNEAASYLEGILENVKVYLNSEAYLFSESS
jgi:hypothetical protein